MAKSFHIQFLLRDAPSDITLPVREGLSIELRDELEELTQNRLTYFYQVETIEGKTYLVNFAYVQGLRFLWDVEEAPPDLVRSDDDIKLQLRGRKEPISEHTEDVDTLAHMFAQLRVGPEAVPFPGFTDEDDEWFSLDPDELVWISAPTHWLAEGYRLLEADRSAPRED